MALEAETILDSGAFSGAVLTMSAVFLGSLYKWPSFDVRGFEVLTHKPSVAAYRAPTAPQTIFADRLAHGADRPRARPRPGRVPAAPPHAGRRSDGERPALAEQRGQAGAARGSPSTRSGRAAREWASSGEQERPRPARHRPGASAAGSRAPADGRHRAAQPRRLAQRAHRPGRHRGHEHRAGPDRRLRLRRRHRQGAHHHRATPTPPR